MSKMHRRELVVFRKVGDRGRLTVRDGDRVIAFTPGESPIVAPFDVHQGEYDIAIDELVGDDEVARLPLALMAVDAAHLNSFLKMPPAAVDRLLAQVDEIAAIGPWPG